MNYRYFISILMIIYVALVISCNNNRNPYAVADKGATDLNAVVTELPDKPGYATFKRECMSCHSARYIQMQPALAEKTWTAIVTKMQKSYGAPVADSSAREIIQYLMLIKGKS
jgi:hypothetical protein